MARSWYGYLGTGNVADPANYLKTSVTPTCIIGSTVCAVYASGTTLNPAGFSANILQYIADSSTGNTGRPLVTGAKFYLYKRS